ncbi:SDR family NAD(P)-dependent oxidoreductase [Halopseudomonas pachastrellae]|nr:SDR family NAD(P)-dependent oxidoreductase [Halopseudomonas pachastrellae]
MNNPQDAQMKVILITGAASGLGWAMAKHWFDAGHSLVMADVNEVLLKQREQELNAPKRVAGDHRRHYQRRRYPAADQGHQRPLRSP